MPFEERKIKDMRIGLKKLVQCIMHPSKIMWGLSVRGIIPMDDERFLKKQFKQFMGYELDLNNPKTFDEKLNWLKLHDRNPLYTQLVDKFEVKQYIAKKIGERYVIPTIGIYNSFDEIDFESLPQQFVLKCTHDSGGLILVKNKNNFNIRVAKKKIKKALTRNYYYRGREWPYKNVKPRIIIEEYVEDTRTNELRDYKFYCFNGIVKGVLVATNRQNQNEELKFDYFDNRFNHLNWKNHWHPNAKITPEKPKKYAKMVELASILSEGFPHVRVDFYEANGNILFGELTFYDQGGYLKIHPDEWENEWGALIDLSLAYDNVKNSMTTV